MTRDIALLVAENGDTVAAVNQHVYTVEDGFLFIDVRPYRHHPQYPEPGADAEADAYALCSLLRSEWVYGVEQKVRAYRPARREESAAWLANPANEARYTGMSEEQVRTQRAEAARAAQHLADQAPVVSPVPAPERVAASPAPKPPVKKTLPPPKKPAPVKSTPPPDLTITLPTPSAPKGDPEEE
jgi:hypothetical protein